MNILITGGAGYAGSHVLKFLSQRGVTCLAYDNFSTGHKSAVPAGQWVEGDIADATQMDAIFAQFKPDAVIHMAAIATLSDCAARPAETQRTNIDGTRILLETMIKHGVTNMVFASSCAVYAPTDKALSEKNPQGSPSVYGQSKQAGERLLAEYGDRVRSVAFRMFNVAGADPDGMIGEDHDPETHLVPLAIAAAFGKRPPLSLFGDDYPTPDGTAVRDYIHVWDIADAFNRALTYLANGGASNAFNMGSGTGTSVRQLLAEVERQTGKKVPATVSPRREGDVALLMADSAHLKKTLGWNPEWSKLETVIATALKWHCK